MAPARHEPISAPIEDYALLSDLHTGPLVSRDGSVDWLCFPRFDSPAVFTSILGKPEDGRWKVSIKDGQVIERRYVGRSFILETIWQSPTGIARVTDFMPPSTDHADLIRHVECLDGTVVVEHDLHIKFDYGRRAAWTRQVTGHGRQKLYSIAGPDGLQLDGPLLEPAAEVDSHLADPEGAAAGHMVGAFEMKDGEELCWSLGWFPSYKQAPQPADYHQARSETLEFWSSWAAKIDATACDEQWQEQVVRSLLVLRALTHSETGGIVAAPTASLPEEFGGERNWDYRFTWLRDAAFTVEAMISHNFVEGAKLWRDWLLRAIAGEPDDLRIMYGLAGEKQLPEQELDHLDGYENSKPVRIGNGAAGQYQADVAGEVMVALDQLRRATGRETDYSWAMQKNLLRYCIENFERKDHGIWEMRGDLHYFTHGRVMMWAAFDRGIRAVEEFDLDGDVEIWREYRQRLEDEIWERGYDRERNTFTQTYDDDSREVDASLLQIPQVGFVPYDHEAMLGTVAAIEEDLQGENGMIHRYRTASGKDGLAGHEYPFLICCFWLVEQYARSGRRDDAERLMRTLVDCGNDLGLLAEEYDPTTGRLAGNFPQAFSHLGLIRAADSLTGRAE